MLDNFTADRLREAVGVAQSGDEDLAQKIAAEALESGGDVAALNGFLGMMRARAGDFAAASEYLKLAHAARPDDLVIIINWIAVLIDRGELAAALDLATEERARADRSMRIARYRGFLAQSLDQFAEAAAAYEWLLSAMPNDFEAWNNLGNARAALGDAEGSVAALERAMAIDGKALPTHLNLAVAYRAKGDADKAVAALRATAAQFPEDARAWHELYVQYKLGKQQEEAIEALEAALAIDPDNGNLQLKYAVECGLTFRTEEAESAYFAALRHDSHLVDAYLGLTVLFEHSNRLSELPPLIAQAQAAGVEAGAVAFMQAFVARREKRFAEALEHVGQVPPQMEPERTQHLRAQILSELGEVDQAFAAFSETNRLHQGSPTQPLQRAAETRDKLRQDLQLMDTAWAASWADVGDEMGQGDGFADPIFLVGFPRSGTTLLDTILMGHSQAIVLEEKPPLNLVDKMLGGTAALADLDARAIAEARQYYFSEVAKVAPHPLDGRRMLIDKSPLFLSKAPLIHRLFPQAKFILALRHPCDALLSCFMSNFHLNNAMSNFLRLEDAAEFYDLTFQHWQRACELFPLQVHSIVYEQLVENVEAEVRPLFDFLGLEWQSAALDHRETAKARGLITTASYAQVGEPIYKRAAGRWQAYRHHLEPILPVLEPWAERFHYEI